LVIKTSPLLLGSLGERPLARPKASGAAITGLMKRRKITPPTAVMTDSGNFFPTIYEAEKKGNNQGVTIWKKEEEKKKNKAANLGKVEANKTEAVRDVGYRVQNGVQEKMEHGPLRWA